MNIACIYMASGFSRRFGSNKLLTFLGDKLLYQHGFFHLQEAVRNLEKKEYCSCRIYVVSSYDDILSWCRKQGADIVKNNEAAEGMAASIRLGVHAAFNADAWAFFAADQPCLRAETIAAFISDCMRSSSSAGYAVCGQRKGSPAFFARPYREELLALCGDTGGRKILENGGRYVRFFHISEGELQDVDTPDVMEAMQKFFKK